MTLRMRVGLARRRALFELRGLQQRLQGRTGLGDEDEYRDACRAAVEDERAFERFKTDPRYSRVLEHVSPEQGEAYLRLALERAPELEGLLGAVAGNDRLGSPVRGAYGSHGEFSPTTLRYFKVLVDLHCLFGTLEGFDVVEIGGGYGGQAFVCSQSAQLGSYTLVDLPEAAALQRKYLDRQGVPGVRVLTPDEVEHGASFGPFDLAISNYAFSELTGPMQRVYIDRLLLRAQRGYLTLNRHTPRAYRTLTLEEVLAALPGSRVLSMEGETPIDRKAAIEIVVWGARAGSTLLS